MKTFFLIASVIISLLICSSTNGAESSTKETDADSKSKIIEIKCVFELQSVIQDKDHKAMGKFLFRHSQKEPIMLSGFGYVDDKGKLTEKPTTVFRVRFETFKIKESEQWKDVPVGYCGTGAKEYLIQPNQNYTFLIPLWPFVEKGTHGIVGLHGPEIKVESKPFETSEIQKIAKNE